MRKSQIVLLAAMAALAMGLGGCSHVADDWKAAQAADTSESYQDFLRQHPDSEFGVPAQERIKQLAENRDWQQASTADTLDAYQQFVAAHADGKWAQEARVRIENFQLNGGARPPAATTALPAADGTAPGAAPGAAAGAGAAAPATQANGPMEKPVAAGPDLAKPSAAKPPASKPATAVAPSSKGPATGGGSHGVQLGAFGSRASAESAWHKLVARFPAQLKPHQPHYLTAQSHGKAVVRLQLRLGTAEQARELCAALKKKSQACVPAH